MQRDLTHYLLDPTNPHRKGCMTPPFVCLFVWCLILCLWGVGFVVFCVCCFIMFFLFCLVVGCVKMVLSLC